MDTPDQVSLQNQDSGFHLENFDKLLQGLREAVNRFQNEQTPESFAGIVTALSGFGLSGADLWKQAAEYTKRNPVRTAIYAGMAFFALRGLMGMRHHRPQLH